MLAKRKKTSLRTFTILIAIAASIFCISLAAAIQSSYAYHQMKRTIHEYIENTDKRNTDLSGDLILLEKKLMGLNERIDALNARLSAQLEAIELAEQEAKKINLSSIDRASHLTSDQFNQAIQSFLTESKVSNSPLVNTGVYLTEVEKRYDINGLYVIAVACLESDYGRSSVARTKNNFFGMMSGTNYQEFSSLSDSYDAFARLIRSRYITDWGLTTIEEIGPRYCPPNKDSWIRSVKWFVEQLSNYI